MQTPLRPINPPERDEIALKKAQPVAVRVMATNVHDEEINATRYQLTSSMVTTLAHCRVERIGQDEFLVAGPGLDLSEGATCSIEAKGYAQVSVRLGAWSGDRSELSSLDLVVLEPERVVRLSVKDGVTGKPLAGAMVLHKRGSGSASGNCIEFFHVQDVFERVQIDGFTDTSGQVVMSGMSQSTACFAVGKWGYQPVHVVAAEGVEQISVLLRPEVPSASFLVGNVRGLEPERLSSAFVMALDEQGRRFFAGVDHNGVAKIPAASGGPFQVFLQYVDPQGIQRAPRTPDWIAWDDMPFEFVVESRTDGSR